MKKPTKRQEEVLEFISQYIKKHKYSPTLQEVAGFFSISGKGAYDHIAALKKKGLLEQGDNKPRTMKLVNSVETNDAQHFKEIPILGVVAAGRPILAVENVDGSLKLHNSLLKNGREYFALRVRGDSMEEAGIMDGDTAVIERQETVRNGEIAVVMLDEEVVTLKTFYRESSRIKLKAENSKYAPLYCSGDVRILGKLAHVIRSYA